MSAPEMRQTTMIGKEEVRKVAEFCGLEVWEPTKDTYDAELFFTKKGKVIQKIEISAGVDMGQGVGYVNDVIFNAPEEL